ncbi:DUF2335 domain-containing protein [Methylobacterium sp. NMS14P]|uniref:DUF2335 domain-containing protein n=1 Tax=Methylobacterium sp. NMS14P TaxID=2894310 RepID=UPI003FD231C3
MQVTSTQHVGPVPAPDTIAEYDAVVPGAADRMIRMAERDQAAFIASNARQQWLDYSFNALCVLAQRRCAWCRSVGRRLPGRRWTRNGGGRCGRCGRRRHHRRYRERPLEKSRLTIEV